MKSRVAATVLVAAIVASACGSGGTGGSEPPPLLTTTVRAATSQASETTTTIPFAEIAQVDCPDHLSRSDGNQLACGVATVAINRADGSPGTTRITIATLAGYDTGFATPVAVLQGGPGGSSSELGSWFPQQPFTQVFVDQRGTGFVGPDFDCPEIVDALGRVLASTSGEGAIVAGEAYDDCARRLDDDIVLQNTDSEAHAADVVEVMAGLGYGRWVVYGVSYGSTIGLEILRDAPSAVAGVVLDGVYPPELDVDRALFESAEAALDHLDSECAATSLCRSYLDDGSVRSTLERVMRELDDEPLVIPLTANEIGYSTGINVVLDGQRAAEFAFLFLYQESQLRFLPAVIGGLDDRDAASARWLARNGARTLISSQRANDEGTYFAVQCHDRLPFTDGPGEESGGFGSAITAAGLSPACTEWERSLAADTADDQVESSIPTLLLSGSFDPVTPAAFADRAAEGLTNHTAIEQGGRGHGIWFGSECIAQVVQLFVADPARTLDTSCADEPVPVEWARP